MRSLVLLLALSGCVPDSTADSHASAVGASVGILVPHLIVYATGEDLGASLGGNCVLAPGDVEVCYASGDAIYFASANCQGDAFVLGEFFTYRSSQRFIGPSMELFQTSPAYYPPGSVTAQSVFRLGTAMDCSSSSTMLDKASRVSRTGRYVPYHVPSDFVIAGR